MIAGGAGVAVAARLSRIVAFERLLIVSLRVICMAHMLRSYM